MVTFHILKDPVNRYLSQRMEPCNWFNQTVIPTLIPKQLTKPSVYEISPASKGEILAGTRSQVTSNFEEN